MSVLSIVYLLDASSCVEHGPSATESMIASEPGHPSVKISDWCSSRSSETKMPRGKPIEDFEQGASQGQVCGRTT
jgi:hypothetical protein